MQRYRQSSIQKPPQGPIVITMQKSKKRFHWWAWISARRQWAQYTPKLTNWKGLGFVDQRKPLDFSWTADNKSAETNLGWNQVINDPLLNAPTQTFPRANSKIFLQVPHSVTCLKFSQSSTQLVVPCLWNRRWWHKSSTEICSQFGLRNDGQLASSKLTAYMLPTNRLYTFFPQGDFEISGCWFGEFEILEP